MESESLFLHSLDPLRSLTRFNILLFTPGFHMFSSGLLTRILGAYHIKPVHAACRDKDMFLDGITVIVLG